MIAPPDSSSCKLFCTARSLRRKQPARPAPRARGTGAGGIRPRAEGGPSRPDRKAQRPKGKGLLPDGLALAYKARRSHPAQLMRWRNPLSLLRVVQIVRTTLFCTMVVISGRILLLNEMLTRIGGVRTLVLKTLARLLFNELSLMCKSHIFTCTCSDCNGNA